MSNPAASPTDLIAAYKRGPAVLREALAGLDADALRARPVPGKLSAIEVACHIVDSDQFMCDRLKRTIATNRPLLMGVESIDYIQGLVYRERDLDLDLHLLEVQRQQMAADLERLPNEAWGRIAVHSERGVQTLLDSLIHAVSHLEDHVESIYEKRRALAH